MSDSAASGDALASSRQPAGVGASTTEGDGRSAADLRRAMLLRHMANPDDPDLPRPPSDARGPRPGPDDRGALGRVAIVQAQVYLVGAIVIAQLFLITTALHELLSGNASPLWWIALASLIGFLLALLIAVWPRRRVKGF